MANVRHRRFHRTVCPVHRATGHAAARRCRHVARHRVVFALSCGVPQSASPMVTRTSLRQPSGSRLGTQRVDESVRPTLSIGMASMHRRDTTNEIGKACSRDAAGRCAGSNPGTCGTGCKPSRSQRHARPTAQRMRSCRHAPCAPSDPPTFRQGATTPGVVMQERTLCAVCVSDQPSAYGPPRSNARLYAGR